MTAALIAATFGLSVIALLGVGGSMVADDRRRSRLLKQRVAVIRPVAGISVRRGALPRVRIAALVAPFTDPIFGVDRRFASDESMIVMQPFLIGVVVGAAVVAAATKLFNLDGVFATFAGILAGVLVARMIVAGKRDGTQLRMEDQFALALGIIIRCVRAGIPVTEGMRAVGAEVVAPTGPEFRRCVDRVQIGGDLDAALAALADRCVIADYRFFATAVALQTQTGGNLAETLENLADTIRRRKAVRLKAQSLMSESRATVIVLAIMPFAVGAMIMFVSPEYILQLFTTSGGKTILGAAIVIQAFGLFIIRLITRGALK